MSAERFAAVEPLEARKLLSASIYPPHAHVRDESVQHLVADWWTRVFQTHVHGADGTTVTHPMLTNGDTTASGRFDGVSFLYGTFGGSATHTATVPTDTPIFVPVLPIEFSNFDTPNPDGSLPGTYTAAQLRDMAAQAALPAQGPGGEVHVIVDGQAVPNVASHREVTGVFSYVLPNDNVDQFFFNDLSLKGRVSPVVADGYYVLLKPLSPGQHTITFGGTTPGGSLGPLNVNVTYTIDVVPNAKDRGDDGTSACHRGGGRFNDERRIADDVL